MTVAVLGRPEAAGEDPVALGLEPVVERVDGGLLVRGGRGRLLSSITETRYCISDHLLWFGAPLVGGRSPLLRTPLPRSDTASRISFKDFLVRRSRSVDCPEERTLGRGAAAAPRGVALVALRPPWPSRHGPPRRSARLPRRRRPAAHGAAAGPVPASAGDVLAGEPGPGGEPEHDGVGQPRRRARAGRRPRRSGRGAGRRTPATSG